MHDVRTNGWAAPWDVTGLLDRFQRVLTQQNEAWLRVLRTAAAGDDTPSEWVADMSDMAQKWYAEVKDHIPRSSGGNEEACRRSSFELDSQAEGADAKTMVLPQPARASSFFTRDCTAIAR